jgi:hypothetical protein
MAETNDFKTIANPNSRSGTVKLLAVFGAITAWALVTGYYQVFSIFAEYDDEGYLMLTVKQFTEGFILYDQIYTQYGPAYYIYKWLPHVFFNLPVTHNVTRLTTLFVWTLIGLVSGLFAYRITRSSLAAAAVYLLAFLALFRTVYEPGHPQELCGLLVISSLFLLTGEIYGRNFEIRIALMGAILAFLCLAKVNVGIFVCLSLAITFFAFTKASKLQRLAFIGLTCAAALLPFVLFREHLFIGWLNLSIIVAVALTATLLIILIRGEKHIFSLRQYLTIAVSFLVTAFLILIFVSLQGTTPEALLNGVVLQHFRFGDNFYMAAPIQRLAIFWAIFALAIAAGILYFARKRPFETRIVGFILKNGFGLTVIMASLIGYYNFLGSFLLLSFATPFLWLLLLQPFENENENENEIISKKRSFSNADLPRTALIFVALLQTLQIYPIAGTQMSYATFTMLIVAVLCLNDAARQAKSLFPQISGNIKLQKSLLIVAALGLFCVAAYRTYANREIYNSQTPFDLAGATKLRLPEKDVAAYNFLVENIQSNCDVFVSMPGINSLYFWTQKEPPTTYNATAWMSLLSDEQQQAIVERLKTERRVCVVYHPQLTQNGLRERDLSSFPLSRYILNNFSVRGEINQYRFMMRDDSSESSFLHSSAGDK